MIVILCAYHLNYFCYYDKIACSANKNRNKLKLKKIMSVMIVLLGASLTVGVIFLIAFIWSIKNGQMEDTFSPAHKILFEDKTVATTTEKKAKTP